MFSTLSEDTKKPHLLLTNLSGWDINLKIFLNVLPVSKFIYEVGVMLYEILQVQRWNVKCHKQDLHVSGIREPPFIDDYSLLIIIYRHIPGAEGIQSEMY